MHRLTRTIGLGKTELSSVATETSASSLQQVADSKEKIETLVKVRSEVRDLIQKIDSGRYVKSQELADDQAALLRTKTKLEAIESTLTEFERKLLPEYWFTTDEVSNIVDEMNPKGGRRNEDGNYVHYLPALETGKTHQSTTDDILSHNLCSSEIQHDKVEVKGTDKTLRILMPYLHNNHFYAIKIDVRGKPEEIKTSLIDPFGLDATAVLNIVKPQLDKHLANYGIENRKYVSRPTAELQYKGGADGLNKDGSSCGVICSKILESLGQAESFGKTVATITNNLRKANGNRAYAVGALELRGEYTSRITAIKRSTEQTLEELGGKKVNATSNKGAGLNLLKKAREMPTIVQSQEALDAKLTVLGKLQEQHNAILDLQGALKQEPDMGKKLQIFKRIKLREGEKDKYQGMLDKLNSQAGLLSEVPEELGRVELRASPAFVANEDSEVEIASDVELENIPINVPELGKSDDSVISDLTMPSEFEELDGSTTEEDFSVVVNKVEAKQALYQSCLSHFHNKKYSDAANDLLTMRQDMSGAEFSELINGGLPNTAIILGDLLSLERKKDEAIEQYGSAIAIGGINSDGIERAYSGRVDANLRSNLPAFQIGITLDSIKEKMLQSQMVDSYMADVIHDLEAIKILKGDSAEYAQYVRLGDKIQQAFGAEKYQELLDQSSNIQRGPIEDQAKTVATLFTEFAAINADNIGLKLEMLTQIISMDEHNVRALIETGNCLCPKIVGEPKSLNQYHDKEAASANYNKAIELDPENPLLAPVYRAKANELLLNTENAFAGNGNISDANLKDASELYNKAHEVATKGGIEEGASDAARRVKVNQAVDERGSLRNVVGIVGTAVAVAIAGSLMNSFGVNPSLIIGSSIAIMATGALLTSQSGSQLSDKVKSVDIGAQVVLSQSIDVVQARPRQQPENTMICTERYESHQQKIEMNNSIEGRVL